MKLNLNSKVKVNSISQNSRKKVMKLKWNTISDETAIIENILKASRPSKGSKSKLSTTMAIYSMKTNFLPATISNRENQNQSQNSRPSKKKEMSYVKQMMNKTVMIPSQDYHPFNSKVVGVKTKIGDGRIKKNSLVIPKQVMMVRSSA